MEQCCADGARYPRGRVVFALRLRCARGLLCRALVVLVALALAAFAQTEQADPAVTPIDITDLAPPQFQVFTSQDGLSDDIWNTVSTDAQGFVWAGSSSALARFDGYRWRMWAFPEARSLVRRMMRTSDGLLWAAFEGEGLAYWDGLQWRIHGKELRPLQHFELLGDEGWVLGERGAARWEQGNWHLHPGTGEEATDVIGLAYTERLGGGPRQWLARYYRQGLLYRERLGDDDFGPWQKLDVPGVTAMAFTSIARSESEGREELWLLSYGDGILRIDEDGPRMWRSRPFCEDFDDWPADLRGHRAPQCRPAELPTEAVYHGVATYTRFGERQFWVSGRAGVIRFQGENLSVFDRRHGLPSDAVRDLHLQRVGVVDVLWVPTESGIARTVLADTPWRTVSLHGARENGTFGALLEPDGRGGERLWVGSSQQGIALLEDGQWRHFRKEDGSLPAEGSRQLWRLSGPDGEIWRLASLMDGALYRIDDELAFHALDTPWPRPSRGAAVEELLAREWQGQRELWAGTRYAGVYRYRDGAWQPEPAWPDLPPGAVYDLLETTGHNGHAWIWAAGEHGLARYDGHQWETVALGETRVPGALQQMQVVEFHGKRQLWVSTRHSGVLRLDLDHADGPVLASSADAVPPALDPTVYSVLQDSVGRIYVCTNNGVQQLLALPEGGFRERVFRRRDGLVHDECNMHGQFIDAQDRVWVGTLGGLSVFEPERADASSARPWGTLRISRIDIDGREVPITQHADLELPPGSRDLRIEFALLRGLRETETLYRSQLEGYDPDFGDWSNEHTRSFSGLAPGSYRLLVEARDFAGQVYAMPALDLQVLPQWWQHRALPWLGLALLALLVWALVLAYNRQLRARQRQLLSEVALRTRELQQANTLLTELSYRDALTGIANRRRLMDALPPAIERAASQGLPLGLMIIDVDHFKLFNDRYGHLAGDAALRAVAEALQQSLLDATPGSSSQATRVARPMEVSNQGLIARFGGEEFACLLLDSDRHRTAAIAERMRAAVAALPAETFGHGAGAITISIGMLSCVPPDGSDIDTLLGSCDQALYDAKDGGRNRVVEAQLDSIPRK